MRCRDRGVENDPTDSRCVRCGSSLVVDEAPGKMPIRTSMKAVIIALLAIGVFCIMVGLAAHTAIHRPSILMTDLEEADVPDDYDIIRLEGEQSGDTYMATLTVAGEIQTESCSYRVGVWAKSIGRSGAYVYDLLYVEGKEQHYSVPVTREGSALAFEFPLSLLDSNAYIVGLSAGTYWPESNTSTHEYLENPSDEYTISHLLELQLSPYVLFGVAVICMIAALTYMILRR